MPSQHGDVPRIYVVAGGAYEGDKQRAGQTTFAAAFESRIILWPSILTACHVPFASNTQDRM